MQKTDFKMKTPIRTCISCRKKAEKDSLLRIIVKDNKISADLSGKQPGRGAYVCKNEACIKRLSQKAINHAFRKILDINNSFNIVLRNDDMDF